MYFNDFKVVSELILLPGLPWKIVFFILMRFSWLNKCFFFYSCKVGLKKLTQQKFCHLVTLVTKFNGKSLLSDPM